MGRVGDRLIAQWPGLGSMSVRRDGNDVRFEWLQSADPIRRAKVEDGISRVLVRTLVGDLGIHGAAVASRKGIIFTGNAGDGKSTLAAALCTNRGDVSLLADDAVAVSGGAVWTIAPTERTHFLDGAAVQALGYDIEREGHLSTSKVSLPPSSTAQSSVELHAIFRLVFDSQCAEPQLRRLRPIEAFAELVPQTIRFAIDETERMKREVDLLTTLAANVATFELRRPRDFGCLEKAVEIVQVAFEDLVP